MNHIKFFKPKIIIFLVFAFAIGALTYFAYSIINKRYAIEEITEIKKESNNEKTNSLPINEEKQTTKDASFEEDEKESESLEEDEPFFNVTSNDCSEKCEKYKKDADDFEYCKQICGLSVPKIGNCSDLEGLEKDYCWKDLAISKTDFKICENIADKGIKKTCINYITEEILNKKI